MDTSYADEYQTVLQKIQQIQKQRNDEIINKFLSDAVLTMNSLRIKVILEQYPSILNEDGMNLLADIMRQYTYCPGELFEEILSIKKQLMFDLEEEIRGYLLSINTGSSNFEKFISEWLTEKSLSEFVNQAIRDAVIQVKPEVLEVLLDYADKEKITVQFDPVTNNKDKFDWDWLEEAALEPCSPISINEYNMLCHIVNNRILKN